jgi:hypothetical protein
MQSTALRPRIVLSALLFATSIALAGCATLPAPPAPVETTPAETPTEAPVEIEATSDGYLYTDNVVGYTVTFPGEPEIQELVTDGTNRPVNVVSYGDPSTLALLTHGEILDEPADLRDELLGWASSVNPDSVQASGSEFKGLPSARADLIMSDGAEATMIVVGEGVRFIRLLAIGGTAEEREAFFDSFEPLD